MKKRLYDQLLDMCIEYEKDVFTSIRNNDTIRNVNIEDLTVGEIDIMATMVDLYILRIPFIPGFD